MTKFTVEQAQALLQQGHSKTEVARKLGVSVGAVHVRLRQFSPLPPLPYDERSNALIERVIAAYQTRNPEKISAKAKFTDEQAYAFLLEEGNLSRAARRLGVGASSMRARIMIWEGHIKDRTGPPIKKAKGESEEQYAARLADVGTRKRGSQKKYRSDPGNAAKIREGEKLRLSQNDARERHNATKLAWYKKNVESHLAYRQKRYRENPEYQLAEKLRARLCNAFKAARVQRPSRKENLTGCNPTELLQHITSRFQEGMTLDNYGRWVLDHMVPVCAFDLLCPLQQLLCFHVSNINPLWKRDNHRKVVQDKLYAEQVRATRGGLWKNPISFPNPALQYLPDKTTKQPK